ncbi:MAG: hypothetical protein AVO35_11835 [Candidatus Aegiribacteria sp. MLS_C]|nr:MAG: hypothetical protein AVO35_11835 [Candidatus Aegiribacteria sp. MLS_C]
MKTDENREKAKRFLQIWGDGDLSIIDDLADPGIEVTYPILPRKVRGSRLFRRIMEGFRSSFPDSKVRLEETVAEGDSVAVRWTFTGTHSGPLLKYRASGVKVTWTGMTIYHFRDGRIVRETGEEDFLGFLRQIGEIDE